MSKEEMQKKQMGEIETIKQEIAQVVMEVAKAVVLAINGEGSWQSIKTKQNGSPEATRHRRRPSLRWPVFSCKTKDKHA